jgi:hypothetical protein
MSNPSDERTHSNGCQHQRSQRLSAPKITHCPQYAPAHLCHAANSQAKSDYTAVLTTAGTCSYPKGWLTSQGYSWSSKPP